MDSLVWSKQIAPVLMVALLTWGGVFAYLLRLERLARHLEERERDGDAR